MAQYWSNNVRLLLVVRDLFKSAANTASYVLYPGIEEGTDNFQGGLVRALVDPVPGEAPEFWACSVQITPNEKQDLRQAFMEQGFSSTEASVILPGDTPVADNNLWIFDGGTEKDDPGYWTYPMVLDALGLRITVGEPT